jgi:hypothetical protein
MIAEPKNLKLDRQIPRFIRQGQRFFAIGKVTVTSATDWVFDKTLDVIRDF